MYNYNKRLRMSRFISLKNPDRLFLLVSGNSAVTW